MLNPMMTGDVPHWETSFPKEVWGAYEDFRNFLFLVWQHLGLPEPTPAQYEIAFRLQHGLDTAEASDISTEELERFNKMPREDIIRCFRSLGKSYITSAYGLWRLMRNPRDEKIMVVSATGSKSKEFVAQTKGIAQSMPLVQWLLEGPRESGATRRDMAEQFDVSGASLSQSYSVVARGITGQITGSRATLLIADDIEVERNSLTEEARRRIIKIVQSDFVPITKTEHGKGDIIFLGTPQTEESIYNTLVKEMGFRCLTIPVRYPNVDKLKNYVLTDTQTGNDVNILATYLRRMFDNEEISYGQCTDSRFGEEELLHIEAKGKASFALQFMLDTSLSDAERYPLRQSDLIVMSCNPLKAPLTVQWGRHNDKHNYIKDISNLGFSGDHLLRPLFVDGEWERYESKVLFVDPSGRGKDETAWAIIGVLNGIMYVLHVGGFASDPAEAMARIAVDARKYDVHTVEVEPNYGQGMWVTAFQPILSNIWPGGCTVKESEWAKGQKEGRIIDTLEPVMAQHRLVFDEDMVRRETKSDDHTFSLMHQLTHITRDRGALRHDDRLDALSGAVAHYQRSMGQDVAEAAKGVLQGRMDDEIDDFLEFMEGGSQIGRSRGVRRDGHRTEVWSSTRH
tara:strand:+ start:333 stop:2207 length:1875 start_codon:yes stop_codon:yes gene_type:complete